MNYYLLGDDHLILRGGGGWSWHFLKKFPDCKIYIEINTDTFKLRVKCETTFQRLCLFFLCIILYYCNSKLLLPSKSPVFAYSAAWSSGLQQHYRPIGDMVTLFSCILRVFKNAFTKCFDF